MIALARRLTQPLLNYVALTDSGLPRKISDAPTAVVHRVARRVASVEAYASHAQKHTDFATTPECFTKISAEPSHAFGRFSVNRFLWKGLTVLKRKRNST